MTQRIHNKLNLIYSLGEYILQLMYISIRSGSPVHQCRFIWPWTSYLYEFISMICAASAEWKHILLGVLSVPSARTNWYYQAIYSVVIKYLSFTDSGEHLLLILLRHGIVLSLFWIRLIYIDLPVCVIHFVTAFQHTFRHNFFGLLQI